MAKAELVKKNLLGSLVPPGTSPVTPRAWVWSQHFLGWFFLFCFAGIEEPREGPLQSETPHSHRVFWQL